MNLGNVIQNRNMYVKNLNEQNLYKVQINRLNQEILLLENEINKLALLKESPEKSNKISIINKNIDIAITNITNKNIKITNRDNEFALKKIYALRETFNRNNEATEKKRLQEIEHVNKINEIKNNNSSAKSNTRKIDDLKLKCKQLYNSKENEINLLNNKKTSNLNRSKTQLALLSNQKINITKQINAMLFKNTKANVNMLKNKLMNIDKQIEQFNLNITNYETIYKQQLEVINNKYDNNLKTLELEIKKHNSDDSKIENIKAKPTDTVKIEKINQKFDSIKEKNKVTTDDTINKLQHTIEKNKSDVEIKNMAVKEKGEQKKLEQQSINNESDMKRKQKIEKEIQLLKSKLMKLKEDKKEINIKENNASKQVIENKNKTANEMNKHYNLDFEERLQKLDDEDEERARLELVRRGWLKDKKCESDTKVTSKTDSNDDDNCEINLEADCVDGAGGGGGGAGNDNDNDTTLYFEDGETDMESLSSLTSKNTREKQIEAEINEPTDISDLNEEECLKTFEKVFQETLKIKQIEKTNKFKSSNVIDVLKNDTTLLNEINTDIINQVKNNNVTSTLSEKHFDHIINKIYEQNDMKTDLDQTKLLLELEYFNFTKKNNIKYYKNKDVRYSYDINVGSGLVNIDKDCNGEIIELCNKKLLIQSGTIFSLHGESYNIAFTGGIIEILKGYINLETQSIIVKKSKFFSEITKEVCVEDFIITNLVGCELRKSIYKWDSGCGIININGTLLENGVFFADRKINKHVKILQNFFKKVVALKQKTQNVHFTIKELEN